MNLKRVRRLYREEGLSLRQRRGRGRHRGVRTARLPTRIERTLVDRLHDRRARRWPALSCLTVVDASPANVWPLRSTRRSTGRHVVRVLEDLVEQRGDCPRRSSSTTARVLQPSPRSWAHGGRVQFRFIQPGKPVQNAFIESFNGKCRDECLNEHLFTSIEEARRCLDHWRLDYNRVRPHSSLGNLTPEAFAQTHRSATPLASNLCAYPWHRFRGSGQDQPSRRRWQSYVRRGTRQRWQTRSGLGRRAVWSGCGPSNQSNKGLAAMQAFFVSRRLAAASRRHNGVGAFVFGIAFRHRGCLTAPAGARVAGRLEPINGVFSESFRVVSGP